MNIKYLSILLINSLKSCSQLNKMRVLVFDTETTGLPKTKILNKYMLDLWPHIVQFSYIIFDTESNTIIKLKDCIIKVPDSFIISEDASKIHGITNEISFSKGVNIAGVLDEFFDDFGNVDHIVGHNISFDKNCLRNVLNYYMLDQPEYKEHCTYNIYGESLDKCCYRYKIELNHHNALSDAKACASLFLLHLNNNE